MIRSAQQYGSLLVLYGNDGSQIGSLSIGEGIFLGHSRDFVVVQFSGMIVTMDKDQRTLGRTVLDSRYRIQSITESGFTATVDRVVEVFDKECNHIDHYTV